jgi:hypothetical protein
VELDSTTVVKIIKDGASTSVWEYHYLRLKSIGRMLEFDWSVKINHFYRKANMCADILINIGCSQGIIVLLSPKFISL